MGIVGFATRGFILQAHSVLARRTARLVVVSGGFMWWFYFPGSQCISEEECTAHGWDIVGSACGVHTVTGAVPDVFLLCCFLFIGTFTIAYAIRSFRQSSYFPSIVSTSWNSSLSIWAKNLDLSSFFQLVKINDNGDCTKGVTKIDILCPPGLCYHFGKQWQIQKNRREGAKFLPKLKKIPPKLGCASQGPLEYTGKQLLAMIAHSAVQSSSNSINTPTILDTRMLIRQRGSHVLTIIASNDTVSLRSLLSVWYA